MLAGGYLLGSIPCGILVSRLMGSPDPRRVGSGNIGATNVMRSAGLKGAVLTLAGDFLKGWIPTFVAQSMGFGPYMVASVGLSSFLGHLFPPYLGFKGGKGVATGAGVLAATGPWILLISATVFLSVVALSRYVSLGSILAAMGAPVCAFILHGQGAIFLLCLILASLVILKHKDNIKRLASGREPKIPFP